MTNLITEEGRKKIQEELENRRTTLRQEIANAIKEAKEQGDLSENAEYSEAKRHQSENESRIAELEAMLKEATVVAFDKSSSEKVQLGSKICVKNSSGKELEFQLVGSNEVDPAMGKISNESPLGKAFLGKKKGDEAEVIIPNGKSRYKILSVE